MSIKPDGTHIEHRSESGQKPLAYIAGTHWRVKEVTNLAEVQQRSPRSIVAEFPELTLGDVHAALAYYWDHRQEIDAEPESISADGDNKSGSNATAVSCLELAVRSGYIGSAPDAPADLSTNPAHMDGFGRD